MNINDRHRAYLRAEQFGPKALDYMIQFWIGSVSMINEGFTDSKSRPDYSHSSWAIEQLQKAFDAIPDDLKHNEERAEMPLVDTNERAENGDPKNLDGVIRTAIEKAIESFGDSDNDGMFNNAGFGMALNRILGNEGGMDGDLVHMILVGRKDIRVLKGGSHYQRVEGTSRPSRLYVIRQRGRELYWSCSTEHGCGWCDQKPKQAFSKSELSKEITRLIDQGWFTNLEVIELAMTA